MFALGNCAITYVPFIKNQYPVRTFEAHVRRGKMSEGIKVRTACSERVYHELVLQVQVVSIGKCIGPAMRL